MIIKANINGSSYVGAFCAANDKIAILSNVATPNDEALIKKALGIDAVRTSISGSYLVGVYIATNSNGILLPNGTRKEEIEKIRSIADGFNIDILDSDLNALGNNIIANDKIAFANPDYSNNEIKKIEDTLGVETLRAHFGSFPTVGANNIITNRGFVINNRALEDEEAYAEKVTAFDVDRSTANLGSLYIGLASVANSKGLVLGSETSGFELARIANALGF